MFKPNKLHHAILCALSASAISGAVHSQMLEEIIVTATKRAENAQDIAVAVTAMSGAAIQDLNVTSFDEYIKYLPNITRAGRGPGQNEIYIRGMASDTSSISVQAAQGVGPTVALYLDEQPITAGGVNLDLYITDIERIEVLGGPQGTLFGASSEAGTVRIITNKPVLNEFSAGFDFGISDTRHGDMSNSIEARINIPVIEDKLAIRIAAYNDNKGGYIDNIPGTFSIDPDLVNKNVAKGFPITISTGTGLVPAAPLTISTNAELVEENFNDASYQGVRIGALYAFNDDWDLTVQHTFQDLKADGVFDYDPTKGDLNVSRFFPDSLTDEVNLTTWTISGRYGALELLYTGGYIDREVHRSIDYTGYNNIAGYVAIYMCNYTYTYPGGPGGNGSYTDAATACFNPDKGWTNDEFTTRQTHEFRFSTDQTKRWRVTAGVFYDNVKLASDGAFVYNGAVDIQQFGTGNKSATVIIDILDRVQNPITLNDRSPRLPGETFINDITRTEKQLAFFGEFSFDITDQLTATVGTRYYDIETTLHGWSGGPYAGECLDGGPAKSFSQVSFCLFKADKEVNNSNLDTKFAKPLKAHDWVPKYSLSYAFTDDLLVYGIYSEGFRGPGQNRGGGKLASNPAFQAVPLSYQSDEVKNIEFGWKATLLDGTMRVNGNIYSVDWTNIQVPRNDPTNIAITMFVDNAIDAEIFGVEVDAVWAATENLTLFAAMSYNDTEVVKVNQDINFANLISEGSPLPVSPKWQGNIRARYSWSIGNYDAYAQAGMVYADDTISALLIDDQHVQPSYVIGDLAFGMRKDDWGVELFINNISDERAVLHFQEQDDVPRITTNRPRTFGLRVSYDYN